MGEYKINNKTETTDLFLEDQNITLLNLKKEWEEYKQMLMKKYPVEEGQKWNFTCDHHKKIDKILNGIKNKE